MSVTPYNRFNQLYVGYGIGYEQATLRLGQPEFSSYTRRISIADSIHW
jgi:hypothetical protein